jgi:hypothetical protein
MENEEEPVPVPSETGFMESWAHPDPDKAPPPPRPARRIPRIVWRVVSVLVFLGFLALAFLGPIRGSFLCPHPGSTASLPLRLIVALIGLGIARAVWILGGSEAEPWRYVGPDGHPRPVQRQGRRRTGAWWALFPWFFFLAFVAALFIFHLGDCG